jgi:hypothetical protein
VDAVFMSFVLFFYFGALLLKIIILSYLPFYKGKGVLFFEKTTCIAQEI